MSTPDTIEDLQAYKRELVSVLLSIEPALRVKVNDYFNNTFAPDMTLTWPGEEQVRYLYLKTSSNPEYLREDVLLASLTPAIFVVLADMQPSVGAAKELQQVLRGTGALMLEERTLRALPYLKDSAKVLRAGQGFRRLRLATA